MRTHTPGSFPAPVRSSATRLTSVLVVLGALLAATCCAAQPITSHPRLFLRATDLPRLRSWALNSNPVYRDGLAALAAQARADMDSGRVPNQDIGAVTYVDYPSEMYAELFAFMSLITTDSTVRDDYAQRARTLLMYIMSRAAMGSAQGQPFRDPQFSTNDRSRWQGESFALTVDWIYPYLSASDKATIRQVFLRWIDENLNGAITGHDHPEPIGLLNDPALARDPVQVRWAANNYFNAHMRNIGLMAMALDAADDPDNSLRSALRNATGAWLYIVDYLMRNDSRGGLFPEGFEYSPQSLGYAAQILLALRTAGQDDPALYGAQVLLTANPFWEDFFSGFLHSLSPVPVPHPDLGQVYQPAWYGDGLNYWAPDAIGVFGPLALYYSGTGRSQRVQEIRWIQTQMAPGGAAGLAGRVRGAPFYLNAILSFMLFDPAAPAPDDPRPNQPLTFWAPGLGRLLSRTGWGPDATWFTFKLSWNLIDHQNGDGNQFELYRRGEWLTKERSGYDLDYGASLNHNALALENDRPDRGPDDYRTLLWRLGSQWAYVASGDPRVLASSFAEQFVYLQGDATKLYNSARENSTDIVHASRSIIWLKPDHIVVYDRAASRTAGRFKRFWLNFANQAVVSGNRATVTTPSGQRLFVTSLLPAGAAITSEAAAVTYGDVAGQEPMRFRLRVEPAGGPQSVRFLHVVQGGDPSASADLVTLVQSTAGTAFEGALVRNTVALFPADLSAPFTGVTYSVPAATTVHRILGLAPSAGYRVASQTTGGNTQVTISTNGTDRYTDAGGVLELSAASAPVITAMGLVNGANFGERVAPGAIVSIFGSGLSASVRSATGLPLPRLLADVRATMNGISLPLFFVSPRQINAQLPFELEGQNSATLQLSVGGVASNPVSAVLSPTAPAIFTLTADGRGPGAILRARDFSLVSPSNPALRNEAVAIYITGLGSVSPSSPTGSPASDSPLSRTAQAPTVLIGSASAQVLFSGLAPGYVGLYQINAVVPPDAPTGDIVPLTVRMGSETSNTVTLAVR